MSSVLGVSCNNTQISVLCLPPYCSKQQPGRRKSHNPTPTLRSCMREGEIFSEPEKNLIIAGGHQIWLDRVEVNCMKRMAAACKQNIDSTFTCGLKTIISSAVNI